MKSKVVVILTVFTALWGGHCGHAQQGHAGDVATPGMQEVATPAAVEVGNKFCPVSKEKVGEMGEAVKYEYNGKIYNLCCPMCKKDFAKDPEKFSKIAEDEVAAGQDQPAAVR